MGNRNSNHQNQKIGVLHFYLLIKLVVEAFEIPFGFELEHFRDIYLYENSKHYKQQMIQIFDRFRIQKQQISKRDPLLKNRFGLICNQGSDKLIVDQRWELNFTKKLMQYLRMIKFKMQVVYQGNGQHQFQRKFKKKYLFQLRLMMFLIKQLRKVFILISQVQKQQRLYDQMCRIRQTFNKKTTWI